MKQVELKRRRKDDLEGIMIQRDLPLGEGKPNYSLRSDLVSRKADITFGQLMQLCPKLKRQWKQVVNPVKEPRRGNVRVLSLHELPDIY